MTLTADRGAVAEHLALHNWSPYIPHALTPRQHVFLWLPDREVLYGGAAGGGKSDGLLAGGLQDVEEPGYAGLILRRRYTDLTKAGALISRSREWLAGTDARWDSQGHAWHFEKYGSRLEFGYIQNDTDLEQYQSAEYQYIGFDELTQFTRYQYTYMLSRLRRLAGSKVPLRLRAGTNPNGVGHQWVKERWRLGSKYDGETPPDGRRFVRALLDDNPHLDQEAYDESLAELDPVLHAQLRWGDWDVNDAGTKFQREWFNIADAAPNDLRIVRYWDLAATEQTKEGHDPDWTAGAKVAITPAGDVWILDMKRKRLTPQKTDRLVRGTAEQDGVAVAIWIEQEPGSSGKRDADNWRRNILRGFEMRPDKVTGSKEVRANPLSSQAEAGNVYLLRGAWNEEFLDEADGFPIGEHDDQIDAASGGYQMLTQHSEWEWS